MAYKFDYKVCFLSYKSRLRVVDMIEHPYKKPSQAMVKVKYFHPYICLSLLSF